MTRLRRPALLFLDLDGVLTDGRVLIDEDGRESKSLSFIDIDALFSFHRRGVPLIAVTGEASRMTEVLQDRFPWSAFHRGAKDKAAVLERVARQRGVPLSEVGFVGDSTKDVEAARIAGWSACPANAVPALRAVVDVVLEAEGGRGAIAELHERVFGE